MIIIKDSFTTKLEMLFAKKLFDSFVDNLQGYEQEAGGIQIVE